VLAACVAAAVLGGCGSSNDKLGATSGPSVALAPTTERVKPAPIAIKTTGGPTLVGARNCGSGVTAGRNTSCAFAESVVKAQTASGSGELSVRSPVSGLIYAMYCTAVPVHLCTGTNNASLYFGDTSRYRTRRCRQGVHAGPHTSCTFAHNVRGAFQREPVAAVQAFSPGPHKLYDMFCTFSSPHVCTGGRHGQDYTVYFP
jgi:hypothetical protein